MGQGSLKGPERKKKVIQFFEVLKMINKNKIIRKIIIITIIKQKNK